MKMMTNFFRKWSKDHTTLLKGSWCFFSEKTHIHLNMFEHHIFGFIFRSKLMTIKRRRQLWWRFSFWQSVWAMVCFNKILFILGTSQKGTILWALYDGIRIENWYISRTAGSKLKSKCQPIRSMTFYSISKKSEDTKAFNCKFFFTKTLV